MDEPKVFLWFRCPCCGEDATDRVEVGGLRSYKQPGFRGVSGQYDASCDSCGETFSTFIAVEPEQRYAKFSDYPGTDIETLVGFSFEDFYEERPPDDPYGIFRAAFREIGRVIEDHGSTTDGYHLINRMAFAQYFSAFEAYLADTLILHVTLNDDAMSSLLKTDKTLRQMKLGLSEVLAEPNIVHARFRGYLRSVVYHRLGQVDALYKSDLGSGIITSKRTGDALAGAVEARHDCVHRNGFTSYGVRNTIFLPEYIGNVASIMRSVVDHVEGLVSSKNGKVTPSSPTEPDTAAPF